MSLSGSQVTQHGVSGYSQILYGDFSIKASAPTLISAFVAADGDSITLSFSEPVTIGAGGNGGFVLTASGGAVTLTYVSGDGSTSLVYSTSRTISYDETITVAYTQPGDGVEASDDGTDVESFGDTAVANQSNINRPTVVAVGGVRRLRRF